MIKVLYIIDSLRSGGKERRLVSLIDSFMHYEDVETELVVLSKEVHYKSIFDLNIKIHYLKRDIRKDLKIISKLNNILNQFKPNIVHCWDNVAAAQFAPLCKLKKIVFINSMITAAPYTKRMSKRYFSHVISYPFSDVLLSNSQAGLDNLYVPKEKGKVIHNGFNFDRLNNLKNKKEIFKKFNLPQNKFIVGMVASFTIKKDFFSLIKAASLLNENFIFLAIGSGEYIEKAKILAEDLNVNNFYFLGKQNDVESIVNIFDVGILLSNPDTHGEGISNAIMEYMVLAKPVIASIGGGTAEIVINDVTGYLVEPKNHSSVAERIKYLFNNPPIAREMGGRGKLRIKNFFSIDKMVTDTYNLYLKNIKN